MKIYDPVGGKASGEPAVPAEVAALEAALRFAELDLIRAHLFDDRIAYNRALEDMAALRRSLELIRSRAATGGNGALSAGGERG